MSASRAAARNKPVLVIKPGRMLWTVAPPGPDEGADEVYDEAFRRAGMLRVFEIDSLFDAAQTLARSRPLRGDRLAILTNGGSVGMMAADALLAGGGKLADFSDETKRALGELLGPNWCRDNVIDMSFDAEAGHYEKALRILLKEPGANAILIIHVPFASVSGLEAARAASAVLGKSSRTVLACWMGFDQAGRRCASCRARASPPTRPRTRPWAPSCIWCGTAATRNCSWRCPPPCPRSSIRTWTRPRPWSSGPWARAGRT
jgi:acetyltransferase